MNRIEQANALRETARVHVHNLIQRAYDEGYAVGNIDKHPSESDRPDEKAVNAAINSVELAAVGLAHARMEETARMCGFEGLTEALGYLITLRDNPVATLLREAVNLAALAGFGERTEAFGWGEWLKRAKAVVGDTAPPPETISVDAPEGLAWMRDTLPAPAPHFLRKAPESINFDEELRKRDSWDFYGLPRTRRIGGTPVYYWAGREGRPGSRYAQKQLGGSVSCEHVVIDETRGPPLDETALAFVCRIVDSVEPWSLGHTICISRKELQPLEEGAWVPKGGATTS